MEYSFVQLNDLPDEVLLIIFKKLNNIALLYSLFGVNKRLNKILHDPIFTNHLNLLQFCSNDCISQLSSPILNRFCLQILPEIHDKIKWLNLELFSMERILLIINYPNLSGLGLYNIQQETAIYLLSSKIFHFDSFNDKYIKTKFTISLNRRLGILVILKLSINIEKEIIIKKVHFSRT
jgi:hypothetical protein